MTATYTQLRDKSWGIRIAGTTPQPGHSYVVAKKSGETKTETVDQVIWSGNGVSLCSIRRASGYGGTGYRPTGRRGYGAGRCSDCGTTLERWMDGYSAGLCHDCI